MTMLLDHPTHLEERICRLCAASQRRLLEPEELFDWATLGSGQLLADELLSTAGLDLDLDADARARLSREEVASILDNGIRFESVLTAGFAMQLAASDDLTDTRVQYMLHEMGEETRHSRAFARLLEELKPAAVNPLRTGVPLRISRTISKQLLGQPALLCVFILAGEEIPDLIQKRSAEHPDTDPLVAAVNRYHRQEEARHLAFARMTLPELWAEAGPLERRRVRHLAPYGIEQLFRSLVHPGVYQAVGLPGWATWKAAHATPERLALRHEATRLVLGALLDAGVLEAGDIPAGWRRLCSVDRMSQPAAA